MRLPSRPTAGLLALAALVPGMASAEDELAAYAVPDAPALTYLGATPTEITQPTSGRQFLTQLASNISQEGAVQQGLAFNTDLWYVLPRPIGIAPLSSYRSLGGYAWANLELSLGTLRTAGSEGDTDLAFGLRTVFYDESDPMLSATYQGVLAKALGACLQKPPPAPVMTAEEQQQCYQDELKKLEPELNSTYSDYVRARWNALKVSAAAATGLRLRNSLLGEGEWLGFSVWGNGSLPIQDWGQLLLYARLDRRARENDTALRGGGRLNIGSAKLNGFGELLYDYDLNAADGEDADNGRWALGVEFQLSDQVWVSTSLGRAFGTGADEEPVALLSALKWNLGAAPVYDPTR